MTEPSADRWPTKAGAVLVPFDFSPAARRALKTASKFAEDPARLHVMYVAPPLQPAEPNVVWADFDESKSIAAAQKSLRDELTKQELPHAVAAARVGYAADVIVDYAREIEAELIVVPSHRRKGLGRWLLGSVTERIVRLAVCPVLVLRVRPEELA